MLMAHEQRLWLRLKLRFQGPLNPHFDGGDCTKQQTKSRYAAGDCSKVERREGGAGETCRWRRSRARADRKKMPTASGATMLMTGTQTPPTFASSDVQGA